MRLCSGGKRWAGVCPTFTEGITGVGGAQGMDTGTQRLGPVKLIIPHVGRRRG